MSTSTFLVFQLQAPFSSWGEVAVGEYRGSAAHPSVSAIVGLLGAALGLERTDEESLDHLRDSYGFAVGILMEGRLLRDYHTAQVPSRSELSDRPRATRRQELDVQNLETILSTRDYQQDAMSLVALQVRAGAQAFRSLEEMAAALRRPIFTLYLGRKACPPAAPLWPQVIPAISALAAFDTFRARFETRRSQVPESTVIEPMPAPIRMAFDDYIAAGAPKDITTWRKDRVIRRAGWLFGDRQEHTSFLASDRSPPVSEEL